MHACGGGVSPFPAGYLEFRFRAGSDSNREATDE